MTNKIRATKASHLLLYKCTNAKLNKNKSLLTQQQPTPAVIWTQRLIVLWDFFPNILQLYNCNTLVSISVSLWKHIESINPKLLSCLPDIVCTTPFCLGGLNLLPNFQKGGAELDRVSTLTGGCWKREGNFFQGGGGASILQKNKNKLKSEKNDKKSLAINKNIFFCHN